MRLFTSGVEGAKEFHENLKGNKSRIKSDLSNFQKTTTKRSPDDPELKQIYRSLIHKYHPDHAHSDEDKKFRTELTAKLNRAYQEGDIETLRLFQ